MRTKPVNLESGARRGPGGAKGAGRKAPDSGKDRRTNGDGPSGPAAGLTWRVTPIGIVRTPFVTYCEPPRHFRRVGRGTVEVFEEFEKGLKDVEGFSHLWLVTLLHLSRGCELLVKPPGSEEQRGLFATRSPDRKNPVGLTLVRLHKVEGRFLQVTGVDLLDGTPLLDIKPYIPSVDAADNPSGGWTAEDSGRGKREGSPD